jgi:hypothetical protein
MDDSSDPILNYEAEDLDIEYDTPADMPTDHMDALERASWHLKMAGQFHEERVELEAMYKREIERLTLRHAQHDRIIRNRIEWHERPVSALHRAIVRDDPKRKTIHLPYGTSKVRVSATPRLEITDRAAALAWAESSYPEILGRTINVTGIKSVAQVTAAGVIDENGEIVPGVTASMPDDSWSVSYGDNS